MLAIQKLNRHSPIQRRQPSDGGVGARDGVVVMARASLRSANRRQQLLAVQHCTELNSSWRGVHEGHGARAAAGER